MTLAGGNKPGPYEVDRSATAPSACNDDPTKDGVAEKERPEPGALFGKRGNSRLSPITGANCKLTLRPSLLSGGPTTSQIGLLAEPRCGAVASVRPIGCRPFRPPGLAILPFPHPAHRTGWADFPLPALAEGFTMSPAGDGAAAC